MEKILGLEEIYQLGLLYSNMGDYEKAKSYYLESKTIKEHPDYSQHTQWRQSQKTGD
jgi:tetratricopeptide (TPR) repeat protein